MSSIRKRPNPCKHEPRCSPPGRSAQALDAFAKVHGWRPKPWEARWIDDGGREKSASFLRKADAQRRLTEIDAALLRGSYIDPSAGRVTFKELADQWLASQTFDAKTREGVTSHLRAHLTPAFGKLEVRAIRPSTVQSWLGTASKSLAPTYVRLLLSTLSAVLGAAAEDGLIQSNPCRARSVQPPAVPPRRVQPWSVEQVQRVVSALPSRYKGTAVVAAGCGLRQGEVFGLRVVDVDFLRQKIEVRQQVKHVTGRGVVTGPPKRGKTRTVPLPETVAAVLSEHLRVYPASGNDLVFTNSADGPINRGAFNSRTWKPALEAAKVEPSRENGFHALRHHYASVLLAGGVSVRALAEYLGHTDPGFTLRVYTHLMPADSDKARHVVDEVLGAPMGQAWAEAPSEDAKLQVSGLAEPLSATCSGT